jgi:hypothetical protein
MLHNTNWHTVHFKVAVTCPLSSLATMPSAVVDSTSPGTTWSRSSGIQTQDPTSAMMVGEGGVGLGWVGKGKMRLIKQVIQQGED